MDWSALIPTLVGGGLSIVTTAVMFRIAVKHERQKRKAEEKKVAAQQAFSAFMKLSNTFNDVANIGRQIDEMFVEATEAGAGDLEAWAKIKPLVVAEVRDAPLGPEELSFLIEDNKAQLFNRAPLIQRRVWNIQASLETYNEQRIEMQRFLSEHSENLEVIDVNRAGGEFRGRLAVQAKLREDALNNLIGQILQMVEEDEPEAFDVTKEFKEAAESFFAEDFPKFEFKREGDDNADP